MQFGLQIETSVLNIKPLCLLQLFLRKEQTLCKMLPEFYTKHEYTKGDPGHIGSVFLLEQKDGERSYEYKIISINEAKYKLILETVNYKEPCG
jgi:hypothetical protein